MAAVKTLTIKYRQKISESLTGVKHPNYGKHHSVAIRQKISNSLKGHSVSAAARQKISKGHKGISFSIEHKRKLSQAHLGKKYNLMSLQGRMNISKALKGCKSSMKGKHISEETKRKISVARTGIGAGDEHWNWQNGISKFPYSQDWTETLKKSIRQRDNYVCQLCEKTQKKEGKKLSIHHIDYDKTNSNPMNLITLCRSCNSKVNSGRKTWTKFFRSKLRLRRVV